MGVNLIDLTLLLSTLGYLCKVPFTDSEYPLVNSLARQKDAIYNIYKRVVALIVMTICLELKCPVSKE